MSNSQLTCDDAGMVGVIKALKAGRAAIFPTDTVYGLGVAVRYASSPQELYDLKRRPADKPIAWLIGSVDDLDCYGEDVTPEARELVEEGWPGALTVVVKASANVPPAFQSAQGTVGLRMPASDVALALIREVGPIAASSANYSGASVPRALEDVASSLRDAVVSVEADVPGSGTASSVIDCSQGEPRVIRP